MKASELMIGDWVYYSHTEDGIAPYKEVVCIKAEDLCCDACIIETHYEPIPLTHEILVKNGFIYNDKPNAPAYEGHGLYIFCLEQGCYSINVGVWQSIEFSFVHEFRHLCLLCKIEKEIEL